jgi:lipopolysaccharide biosynthesis regulator YciM
MSISISGAPKYSLIRKNIQKAIDQYLEVLKKDKNHLLANRQAGKLYRQTGDSGRALPFLEKALELDTKRL